MAKVSFLNFTEGSNYALSPFIHPPTSLVLANGVNTSHNLGAILKDLGYEIKDAQIQAGKSILGLHHFRQNASTEKMLATMNDSTDDDTQLFYWTGSTWTEIGAAETAWVNFADMYVEMETFIGYCFFVGYGATDGFLPVGSLTGTTFSTSDQVTSMPQGKYIKRYRDRLYVYNSRYPSTDYPFRCYFSSVPSAGSITWTPSSDFFDVDFGEEGTGLGTIQDRLVLFTENSAYFYDQSFLKKVWDIGGYHRTIQNHGPYIIFANSDGVWWSTGGQPQNISGPYIDFFRAGGDPSAWFSALVDREYIIFIGSVTVDGVSYANLELVFDIPTTQWRIRENADRLTTFARKIDSGKQYRWMGDNDGKVYQKGKYTDSTLISSDNGAAITANFIFPYIYLGGFEGDMIKITAYAEKAQGLKLKGRILDRNRRILTPYKPIGELNKYVNDFDVNISNGVLLQLSGSEHGTSEYFSFFGVEVDVELTGQVIKT